MNKHFSNKASHFMQQCSTILFLPGDTYLSFLTDDITSLY